ncbi:hypothetical protein BJF79_31130 [Actinomadura sp. CNU-125]|uniref:hypothetical protein n=1 Tax=Actinomadura sp. CNU-125 TaxID=1904961 RepID=UPI00095E3F12|nr:hypothetical protein [Actinomadura sp. CNU-125]OLT36507.1 hypothetical protein BJF79_31130 [Actinomadura sp. CNU-125]
MRRAVLDTGAVAVDMPARLRTLALHDRLDEWAAEDAGWAPELLDDPDPDVRANAVACCRTASGPMLHALWDADTGPGTPLRNVLLSGGAPPPGPAFEALWAAWLDTSADTPADGLGDALLRWGRPADDGRFAALSVVALETDVPNLARPPTGRRCWSRCSCAAIRSATSPPGRPAR